MGDVNYVPSIIPPAGPPPLTYGDPGEEAPVPTPVIPETPAPEIPVTPPDSELPVNP
jgi:hypothetical protein